MTETILYNKTDERGKLFQILGDKPKVLEDLRELIGVPNDDDELGLDHLGGDNRWGDNDHFTDAARKREEEQIQILINQIEEEQYHLWFPQIPMKKNGTFAKGRVTVLWRGTSFESFWEDSYGYNGPELVLRTLDDLTVRLQVEWRVRKI